MQKKIIIKDLLENYYLGYKGEIKMNAKQKLLWKLGYAPLKEKKDMSIMRYIKNKIRTRSGRELEAKIEDIMRECKLYNGSFEYAMHLNTEKKSENHYITMWKLPDGLGYEDYIDKQNIFEANLNAYIKIEEQHGALMIEIIKGSIPNKVPYRFKYKNHKDVNILPLPIGVGNGKKEIIWDLARVVHILVSGSTDGGKTNEMLGWIDALLQNPNVNLYLIDLAMKSFYPYRNHTIFAGELEKARKVLIYLLHIVEVHKQVLVNFGTLDIEKYNAKNINDPLPYNILFMDEFALTSPKIKLSAEQKDLCREIQSMVIELSSVGRAFGIHLIVGMQKPGNNLMPKEAKDNFSGRIAFRANDQGHSMAMLGNTKAFYLPKIKGRMIAQFDETLKVQGMLMDEKRRDKRLSKLPKRIDIGFESYWKMIELMEEDEGADLPSRGGRL